MTTPSTTDLSRAVLSRAVQLADSQVYEEYLVLNPLPSSTAGHDLAIYSRLDSARDPDALHTRYRLALSTAALERLHRYLGEYLQALTDGHGSQSA